MVRTQISMTEEQAEGLRSLAAKRRRSQAALLREALDELLAGNDRERRLDTARQVVGKYESAHENTAEEHDAALDEAFST